MVKIRVRNTSLVKPAEKTVRRSIRLTLLDRVFEFPRCNSVVNIYRPDKSATVDAVALRESLSKVLVYFYPMAGRAKDVDEFGITEIDCNDEGVLFVEAETDSDLDHLGDFAPSPDTSILVPPMLPTHDMSSYPLMAVQLTYFNCGGVSLGIRMERQCMSSDFNLIKSWSEISRGLNISNPPFVDRALMIQPRNPPQPKFEHLEYSQYVPPRLDPTKQVTVSMISLTRDQLDQIKAISGHNHSTYEAVAGHIWRSVSKARGLRAGEETRLMANISVRLNRLKPDLPRGFFGNAVMRLMAVSSAGELESKPLSHAADQIHKAILRMNNEYLRSAIDHLATLPDFMVAKAGPHMNDSPNFQVTSWAHIGLENADFGWGPPIYAGPGNIRNEKAYVYPSSGHIGGLSIAIALRAEHMELFKKYFYELYVKGTASKM